MGEQNGHHGRNKKFLNAARRKVAICLAYQATIRPVTTDDGRPGLCLECPWCRQCETVAGTTDQSRKRAILLLEEECDAG